MDDLVERKLEMLFRDLKPYADKSIGSLRIGMDEVHAILALEARIQALETSLAEAGEQLRKNAETLGQVRAAIVEARRQALEEAAKVAGELEVSGKTTTMEWANCMAHARDIAQAIRALASDPLLDRQGNGK